MSRYLLLLSAVALGAAAGMVHADGERGPDRLDGPVSKCRFCDIRYEDLSVRDLSDVDLTGAFLHGVNFSWSVFAGSRFNSANLGFAQMEWSDFDGADFSRAYLQRAAMFRSTFRKANLRMANLAGSNLAKSELGEANLLTAVLRDADLTEARLRGAVLRQADLSLRALVVPGQRLAAHAWFSAPVVTEYNVILTHRGKGLAVRQVSDLYGKRIAGRVGYRYPLLEGDDGVQLSRYQTNGEMIRAMLLDREDMVIISGVSDIFAFRAEGIMSRLEIIDTAIGSVPLVVAFSREHFSESDVAAFNRRIDALKQDARWQQILGRNGMSDLVREWPVLAR